MSDYCGWTNWATWQVNIWSDENETIYRDKVRRGFRKWTGASVREFITDWFPDGTPDMDGPHEYDDVNWDELAADWNEVEY